MTLLVSATPEEWKPASDEAGDGERDLAARARAAYLQRFAAYERELAAAVNQLGALSPRLAPSTYPSLTIALDGEEEAVAFDFGLYEHLLELYVLEGWDGVAAVAKALDAQLAPTALEPRGGGVVVDRTALWRPVRAFFQFTRSLLLLLVRDALVSVERKAARAIFDGLGAAAGIVARTWKDLDVERTTREELVPFSEGRRVQVRIFRLRNRALATALFQALGDAVAQKRAYEALMDRLARVREVLASTRQRLSDPRRSGYRRARLEDQRQRLELREEELKRLGDQAGALLTAALAVFRTNCPLGLLVLDGLAPGFTQEELERKLGQALWALYERIDELGRGLDPERSQVAAALPTGEVDVAWRPPPACEARGPERFLVDAALAAVAEAPGWLPLAHEATWYRLVTSGAIARDSLEYVVAVRYVTALADELEARQADERASQAFWKGLAKVSAALSLLLLVTPAAPILRAASLSADLVVLAHGLRSTVDALSRIDAALAAELVQPDAFALENLAQVGELLAVRPELAGALTTQLLLELVVLAAANQLPLVKRLVHLRGYYLDVELLLLDGAG